MMILPSIRIFAAAALLTLAGLTVHAAETDHVFIQTIRPGHPRMFVTPDTIERIRENAQGPLADLYQDIKTEAKRSLSNDLQFKIYECMIPSYMLVYWVDGDEQFKDAALQILREGMPYLKQQFENRIPVSWFSFSRISLLMGYDWLYDDLSKEERVHFAKLFMENVDNLNNWQQTGGKIDRENYFGFPDGGFYGVQNLYWFAGLCFYGEDVDDARCEEWMIRGAKDYQTLADYRGGSAGDDGGMSAVTLGYVFGAYPRAEWNFIHTYRSAFGENKAAEFSYLAKLGNWINWMAIRGPDGELYQFGMGDAHHQDNRMPLSNLHLAQMQYFYGDCFPEESATAAYLREINPKKDYSGWHFEPFYAFLLDWNQLAGEKPLRPDASWPLARHFENLGHFFFRSGHGENDTYAFFNAGGHDASHTHADEGHFTIYHKGFLALDTGTRDQSGKGNEAAVAAAHTREYYNRTIAHNCVLVQMPGETFDHHWGFVPKNNDGGQNRAGAGNIKAFSTGEQYAYVHADLSPVYSSKKVDAIDRQFFYLPPSHFVVIDRVNAVSADYPKTWLLHTQQEPELSGNTLKTIEGDGVLFCKTLYPVDAKLSLVGGPGREFEVNSTNYPVSSAYLKDKTQTDYLMGNWRLQVTPGAPRKNDLFVHVLEVGDKGGLTQMHETSIEEAGDSLTIHITMDGTCRVLLSFNKESPEAGRIQILKNKQTVCDEPFAQNIQPQAGVKGSSR